MAVPVTVPRLGLAEGEGLIAEWYLVDGASVQPGDLLYRIETEFASIEVEADGEGVFRHAPAAASSPTDGDIVAYLLSPEDAAPIEDPPASQPAPAAEHPKPAPRKASKGRGRSKVYPLKDVLEAAAIPDVGQEPAVPEGLPWDPFPAAEPAPAEEVFEAPKPLLLFPRIVNELKEEAAVEAEEYEDIPPADESESPPTLSNAAKESGWELVPGENDFNPDWLLERNEAADAAPAKKHRFQASSIRDLALGRARVAEPEPSAVDEEAEAPAAEGEASPPPEPAVGMSEAELPELPDTDVHEAAERRPGERRGSQALFARVTIDVTEASKMRDQLTREWMGSNVRPADEDIVLRAIARALHEGAAFRRHTDVVGVRMLTGTSRNVHVLTDAATRPFRDAVASLAALRATPGVEMPGICTLTNYGAFGLDDATPALVDGQALAFGMGAVRVVPIFRGDRPLRASVLTVTLSYDPEAIPDGAAARLLSRVCELVEAPYALLAD